ncbi:Phloem protein 2-like a1 [Thalictrum thalictroides]|uniref:Phloem protein 2-like a1 n=1 Tax=Thalictrum thalictroides TaxID=46969 RepID=A0A7J6WQS8_THATH|nr:Phloem protein 2-like a1 [Thalictrum thalictroides]
MGASQSQHNATDEQTKPIPIERKLPYKYMNIMKEADSRINFILTDQLYERLQHGVFLNQKRKKYWIEKESGHNCFMLYARDLTIGGSDDREIWNWSNTIETSSSNIDTYIDVAELIEYADDSLKVEGKFNTSNLSPNTMYEILFVVKLSDLSYGWHEPVKFSLTLPDGKTNEHEETLQEKPREQWIEVQVGEFNTSPDKIGFSMILADANTKVRKLGLTIKGVIIRPKRV